MRRGVGRWTEEERAEGVCACFILFYCFPAAIGYRARERRREGERQITALRIFEDYHLHTLHRFGPRFQTSIHLDRD